MVSLSGLSPRGRGNHFHTNNLRRRMRSIPAWAGQPWETVTRAIKRAVYPRVGGATAPPISPLGPRRGLSPRGRGNRGIFTIGADCYRSIPAWAGQPASDGEFGNQCTVYPRVGGATRCCYDDPSPCGGLSPRGRGNRIPLLVLVVRIGSIPAWAGQPVELETRRRRT